MLTNELLLRLLWATRELCIIYESEGDDIARLEILGGVKDALAGIRRQSTPSAIFSDILGNYNVNIADWFAQESIFAAIQYSLDELMADPENVA